MRESGPINDRGDRLLLPGEPGKIERWVQARHETARLQAEHRILEALEHVPGLLDVMTQEQVDTLVAICLSIAAETARCHARALLEALPKALDYVPSLESVPSVHNTPNLVEVEGSPPAAE